jgi:K+-transporting ATPase ATPase C chain
MTAIAGVIFPKQAQGSLIEKDGKVIGSALIGRSSRTTNISTAALGDLGAGPGRLHQDRSAPYNAANSGGSNLGPTSKALADRIKEDVEKLKAENPRGRAGRSRHHLGQRPRSRHFAGGALFQVPRVAKARNMPEDRVRNWSGAHQGRLPDCSASPALTYWRSIWRWTGFQMTRLGRAEAEDYIASWPNPPRP